MVCNTVNLGGGRHLRGVLVYILCIPTLLGSAGCVFLCLMFSRAKSSISKCKNHIMFKLLPNIWIRLEQIHVFKTSLTAEPTVSLFITLSKVILSPFCLAQFCLHFKVYFPLPLLLPVLTLSSLNIPRLPSQFYLIATLISYQFTLHLIVSLSPASYKLLEGRGSLQLTVSVCSSSSIHPRTASCMQRTLENSVGLISRQDYVRPFPSHSLIPNESSIVTSGENSNQDWVRETKA